PIIVTGSVKALTIIKGVRPVHLLRARLTPHKSSCSIKYRLFPGKSDRLNTLLHRPCAHGAAHTTSSKRLIVGFGPLIRGTHSIKSHLVFYIHGRGPKRSLTCVGKRDQIEGTLSPSVVEHTKKLMNL